MMNQKHRFCKRQEAVLLILHKTEKERLANLLFCDDPLFFCCVTAHF